VRHIEPSLAPHMELHRLSNFAIRFVPTENRTLHLFAATPLPASAATAAVAPAAKDEKKSLTTAGAKDEKTGSNAAGGTGAGGEKAEPAPRPGEYDGRRFFVRVLVRQVESAALYRESPEFYTGGAVSSNGSGGGAATAKSSTSARAALPMPSSSASAGASAAAASLSSSSAGPVHVPDLDAHPETEFAFVEALNSLEVAMGRTGDPSAPSGSTTPGGATFGSGASAPAPGAAPAAAPAAAQGEGKTLWKNNHVFINVLVEGIMGEAYIEGVIRMLARYVHHSLTRPIPSSRAGGFSHSLLSDDGLTCFLPSARASALCFCSLPPLQSLL
jgi:hypothetical protein